MDEALQGIENVRQMYEEEKSSTKSLKKELASYQRQMKEARLAKEEAKIVRTKLQELQAIENLVKGEALSCKSDCWMLPGMDNLTVLK